MAEKASTITKDDNMHLHKYLYIIKHLTVRKAYNICLLELEKMISKTRLRSKPIILNTDVTNTCNLHCINCLAEKKRKKHGTGFMQFSVFKKIIDLTKDYVFVANLYLWGEPFLNKDIFKMIRYADKNGIYTKISSNMNICSRGFAENIIDSGLKELRINIPTFNKTNYRKYTKTGNLDVVKENIRNISDLKKRMNKRNPTIEILFLAPDTVHNEPFKYRKHFSDWGADRFTNKLMLSGNYQKASEDRPTKKKPIAPERSGKKCRLLWDSLIINFNGTVEPCYMVYYYIRADVLQKELNDIRNPREIVRMRRGFIKNNMDTACSRCRMLNLYHRMDSEKTAGI